LESTLNCLPRSASKRKQQEVRTYRAANLPDRRHESVGVSDTPLRQFDDFFGN